MTNTHRLVVSHTNKSTSQIIIISILTLILGFSMITTFVPNLLLNFLGIIVTSLFVYQFTLRKHDFFSFIMVIYICGIFPYLMAKGGGFNLVSLICIVFYYAEYKKFPGVKNTRDIWFNLFFSLFIMSSLLGWFFNYTGSGLDIVYSFLSFFGVVCLLLLSSRLEISTEKIKVFLQLSFAVIIYSTIVSINKYAHIVTSNIPIMPINSADEYIKGVFEGGGVIGNSPLYGEHSMILLFLFVTVFLLNKGNIKVSNSLLLLASFIAIINVFMSSSRSVFLLSLIGLGAIFLLQFKIRRIRLSRVIMQIAIVFFLGELTLTTIEKYGLDYVFDRVDEIEERNINEGGVTLERLMDGSAFNRRAAFFEGYRRYHSKNSWLIGYGWGVGKNNRDAYYVDPTIERGTAHSQFFAVLFILGWIGFIAYFGLILRIIIKSYITLGNNKTDYSNKILAFFFMILFSAFLFNEIKADSINFPSYFSVTIIWMGLAFSVNNQSNIAIVSNEGV